MLTPTELKTFESRRRDAMRRSALLAHKAGMTWEQFLEATAGQFRHPEPRLYEDVQRETLWLLELVAFGRSDIEPVDTEAG